MTFPGPLGPDYWFQSFGISTEAEFNAAATPVLDAGLPHIGFIDNIALKAAYFNPVSAEGAYITAGLTAIGFHEESPSGPATVVRNSLWPLAVNNNAQESAMSSLVIPSCFQVTIQASAGGHAIDNVIGVKNASGTAAGAAAAVKAAWEIATGPLANLSSLVTMVNYHSVDIGTTTGTIADLASTTGGGAGAAQLSTRAACALVKWNGSNRSRSTRGRLYYGPINEGNINADGATLVTASATSFATSFTAFRNSLNTSGYPLVVLSRKLSSSFDVTAHAIESQIATQRRRIRH